MIAMKNKKILSIVLVLAVVLSLGGLYYLGTVCKTDGTNVCYDGSVNRFNLEEKIDLKVAVETEATKIELERLWEEYYPETKIVVDVVDAFTRHELSQDIAYDVYYVDGSEALYFMQEFANLGQKAQSVITNTIPIGLQDSYNINGLKFVPQNVSGSKLYLNKTLLDQMELTLEDVASFEKIKENEDIILQSMDVSFPFSFKDQATFYPFLTAGGWTLNYTHDGMNPNIDSDSFLEGLEFIQFMSTLKLNNLEEKVSGMDLDYTFEDRFFNRKSLFGYIMDHDLGEQYKNISNDEWLEIPFPTYKGKHLAQEVEVNGYVVNKDTLYPSASAEVLRLLRLPNFLELGDETKNPIYMFGENDIIEISPALKSRINSLIYGDLPTILALDIDPRVRSINLYKEVDFMEITAQVFDGTLSPEEGQSKLLELSQLWLEQYQPIEESTQ